MNNKNLPLLLLLKLVQALTKSLIQLEFKLMDEVLPDEAQLPF